MNKLVLGFCGPEGAGKSTAAKLLETFPSSTTIPFAYPLKQMLRSLGVPDKHLYGTLEEKKVPLDLLCGRSAREAMQLLGTEWGRDLIGPDIWVHAWTRAVELSRASVIVADDLRFLNEAAAVHELGGQVVCILRPEADDRTGQPAHRSQEYWKLPRDATIMNDGNLNQLRSSLIDLVRQHQQNVAA